MIHIVFNEADVRVIQEAQALDSSLEGTILLVRDDYAVGPIRDVFTEEGAAARKAWWAEVLSGGDHAGLAEQGLVNDAAVVAELRSLLEADPGEVAWIWAGQNKHDVSGYYWLMSQLKDLVGKVFILYMNNLPFINEKGHIFYPEWLQLIPPREFLKAKKLARPITLSEFEVDPDEWNRICNEDKGVRLLPDWQKGSRIISTFLSKNKQTTGDAYLLWRLKQLVALSGIDMQGQLNNMKDFELKTPSSVNTAEGNAEERY
jgi:hypothetical protein